MPPRVANADVGGGVQNWYQQIPPVTRFYATACFALTAAVYLGIVNPLTVALYWPLVWKKFQVWRLFTSAFFIGKFSFSFVIQMIWLVQQGSQLEANTFMLNVADYAFMLLYGHTLVALLALAWPSQELLFTASPLILIVVYVWSRHFPTQRVSIMGLFTIQSFYLPFAFLGLTIVFGNSPIPDVIGIIIGHSYFFLKELYPRQSGRHLLQTPAWLTSLVNSAHAGLGEVPPAGPEDTPGFRAFRGGGRRLGAD